ncbi:hypothetical protein ACTFIU_009611 [Dictyostelium citrinum]
MNFSLEQLQSLWNKGKYIQVLKGNNDLSKLVLKTSTSSCEIYIHGAHITSFKTNSIEHLFMSEKSGFQDMKAIRGGVPLIWPQFGNGKIQTHGFARNCDWEIHKALVDEKAQSVQIEFLLRNNDYSDKIWNCNITSGKEAINSFHTIYRVTLHPDFLDLEFDVKNTCTSGSSSSDSANILEFQLAFHTYYQISNIENVYVLGLEGREYIDKMNNHKITKELNDKVQITNETDRVYLNVVPTQSTGVGKNYQPLQLIDNGSKTSITLTYDYQSMPDVVVWNPWIEKSKKMEDFGDNEYHNMICIEIGTINTPVKLSPNQSFQTKHSILPSNKSSL